MMYRTKRESVSAQATRRERGSAAPLINHSGSLPAELSDTYEPFLFG